MPVHLIRGLAYANLGAKILNYQKAMLVYKFPGGVEGNALAGAEAVPANTVRLELVFMAQTEISF